jgi:hypothetical protein
MRRVNSKVSRRGLLDPLSLRSGVHPECAHSGLNAMFALVPWGASIPAPAADNNPIDGRDPRRAAERWRGEQPWLGQTTFLSLWLHS